MKKNDTLLQQNPLSIGALDSGILGISLPAIELQATTGRIVNLASLPERSVMVVYPATGVPGRDPLSDPAPGWDDQPGAPGCTPQLLGYHQRINNLKSSGFYVFGVSAQPLVEQTDFYLRHNLQFPLVNDSEFLLAEHLGLPTFEVAGKKFYRRVTLVIHRGVVQHLVHPVSDPGDDARRIALLIEKGFGKAT